jgi:hypothetical protein
MRPGPVVQVVRVVDQRPTVQATFTVQPAHRTQQLSASLQRLEPVLEAIKTAQSFWFVDTLFEGRYERLGKQAEQLLKQLKSQRR